MRVQNEVEAYIRQAALARGIDPDTAVRVARSEGGLNDPFRRAAGPAPKSQAAGLGATENSFGPLQLYISGTGAGLGDRALKAGIDPRNDWQGGVDFALDEVARDGWRQWYGAAKAGVGRWDGVRGEGVAARPIGVTGGMAALPTEGPVPNTPESAAAAYAPVNSNAGLLAIENLMNAAQPDSQMPVPSLTGVQPSSAPVPQIEPAPALTEATGKKPVSPLPPFAIDRPYGYMPEPASSLPSSVPDEPGLLDRLLNGDVGGFRENVQGFEQSLGGPASRGTIPVAMADAEPAGIPVNPPASFAAQAGAAIGSMIPKSHAAEAGATIGAMAGQQPKPMQGPQMPNTGLADPAQANQATDFDTLGLLDKPMLSPGAGLPFVDQTPQRTLAMEDLTMLPGGGLNPGAPVIGDLGKLNTFTAQPMPQPVQQGPAPVEMGDMGGAAAGANGGFAPLPAGAAAPTPTAKPAQPAKKFDTIGFLGALGSVMAALDQGSPELSSVSLPGVLHKPGAFQGLPMPKGLL